MKILNKSEDFVPYYSLQWTERSRSPFGEENTFDRFTADMVRQYIQEEEVRAKHQAALLALREKAIIDKTKAEMAYLENLKQSLKGKNADVQMPPITKKQRGLVMKLKSEQVRIVDIFRTRKVGDRSLQRISLSKKYVIPFSRVY